MKTPLIPALVASALLAITGCGSKDTATVKPVRETTFAEVTRQLDAGGSVYGYLSTDQWMAGLSTNVAQLGELLTGLPDVSEQDSRQIQQVVKLLADGVRDSGLENLNGIGVSGIEVSPGLHRTKFILHHGKGRGEGAFWNIMGREVHALDGLNLLTTNTAIASFSDLDFPLLWKSLQDGLRDVPELGPAISQWPQLFEKQTGMSWAKVIESLGGEVGLVLTLDSAKKVSFPMGQQTIEFPEPGLLVMMKVKDNLIYDRLSSEMKKSGVAEITDEKDLKLTAMRLPVPLPMDVQVTLAVGEGYLFLASSPALVRNALAVRAGKQVGLSQTPEFAELMKYLPAKGNQFSYVDRRFSSTIQEVQKQFLSRLPGTEAQSKLMQKLFFGQAAAFGLSVSGHTETGWQTVSVGNQDSATALAAAPAVGGVAVFSAMLLPALAKSKAKAQEINCINNMKQLGLALRIWAGDNDDKYPFHVATEKGGTMQMCDRNTEGYDLASWRHFQVMSNELSTPKILICPQDSSKKPAANFQSLQPENVSYLIRSGKEVTEVNPQEVLTYCPVHGHIGLTDGSVHRGNK